MFDCEESSQQFPVKSGIAGFCWGKFVGEEGKRLPGTMVFCCRTAPTWEFEASVARESWAEGPGKWRGMAEAREDLTV
jgi:hypothetical protein